MKVLGIVCIVLGGIAAVFGYVQNNSLSSQLTSLFSSGSLNPGTPFIVIGLVAIVLGVVLCVLGSRKKPQA